MWDTCIGMVGGEKSKSKLFSQGNQQGIKVVDSDVMLGVNRTTSMVKGVRTVKLDLLHFNFDATTKTLGVEPLPSYLLFCCLSAVLGLCLLLADFARTCAVIVNVPDLRHTPPSQRSCSGE